MAKPDFSLDHVTELSTLYYNINNRPLQTVFTRALFADCFKGLPVDQLSKTNKSLILLPTKSELQKESALQEFVLPQLHYKDSVIKNTTLDNRSRSLQEAPLLESAKKEPKKAPSPHKYISPQSHNKDPNAPKPIKSSKFYNSIIYTLSLLNKSDDETSSDNSGVSLSEEFGPKEKLGTFSVEKEAVSIQFPPLTETDSDLSDIEQQMRMLGLPTRFGNSLNKTKKAKRSCNMQNFNMDHITVLHSQSLLRTKYWSNAACSTEDIDESSNHLTKNLRSYSSDDSIYDIASIIITSLCRTLELGCSFLQTRAYIPKNLSVDIHKSWSFASRKNIDERIGALLSSGHALRYKPNCALSNRKVVGAASTQLVDLIGVDMDVAAVEKYWAQRYRLFSRFDQGIQIDSEGLFSVTPEVIAAHHACRFSNLIDGSTSSRTVVDLFAGVGGNSIQLALRGFNVIAVDLSAKMLSMAKNNATVYGVDDKITFIQSNVFDWLEMQIHSQPSFDAIYASPPWGGPAYIKRSSFDLNCITFDRSSGNETEAASSIWDLVRLVTRATSVAEAPLGLFLPRNTNIAQLFDLQRVAVEAAGGIRERSVMEVELALIHNKAKALTVYLYDKQEYEQFSEVKSDSSSFYDGMADD